MFILKNFRSSIKSKKRNMNEIRLKALIILVLIVILIVNCQEEDGNDISNEDFAEIEYFEIDSANTKECLDELSTKINIVSSLNPLNSSVSDSLQLLIGSILKSLETDDNNEAFFQLDTLKNSIQNLIYSEKISNENGNLWMLLVETAIVRLDAFTFIPDDNFELALIDLGLDSLPLNDSISTKTIAEVKNLDVNNKSIEDLTGIENFRILTSLDFYENKITSLDVSKNKSLRYLIGFSNPLQKLNLSGVYSLEIVSVGPCQLKELNLSDRKSLTDLFCPASELEKLNINNCKALNRLGLWDNNLSYLDVSTNIGLKFLNCPNNELMELDISNNIFLEYLECYLNPNLNCIKVKDTSNIDFEYRIDKHMYLSENCEN